MKRRTMSGAGSKGRMAVALLALGVLWLALAPPAGAAPMAAEERQRFAFQMLGEVQQLSDQMPQLSGERAAEMKGARDTVVQSGTLNDYRGLAGQQEFLLWKVQNRTETLTAALSQLARGRFADLSAEMEEWKIVAEQLRETDTYVAIEELKRAGRLPKDLGINGEAVRDVFTRSFSQLQNDIVEPFVNGTLPKK